jgi:hypothetical protein
VAEYVPGNKVGGSFKITFGESTSSDIPVTASASDLQTTLDRMTSIGQVSVVKQEGNAYGHGSLWKVTFLTNAGDLPKMTIDTAQTAGVGFNFIVSETVKGTSKPTIRALSLSAAAKQFEIQSISIAATSTLSGSFRLQYCSLTTHIIGYAEVMYGSHYAVTKTDLTPSLSRGDYFKIGQQVFRLPMDGIFDASTMYLGKAYMGYNRSSLPVVSCIWQETGNIPVDSSGSDVKSALQAQ